jgi:tetratricopeptide (TPR) repeat protein
MVLEEALQKIDSSKLAYEIADCCIFKGDYERALRQFPEEVVTALRHRVNYYLTKGTIYHYMNDTAMSKACYDSVRVMIEPSLRPESGSANHARLGLAYAGLGRKEEAIREGRLAVELLPLSEDAFVGTMRLGFLAMIYTMVEEYDLAIDQLEILLSVPSFYSIPYLRRFPMYVPLRDLPRFQRLLEEYG